MALALRDLRPAARARQRPSLKVVEARRGTARVLVAVAVIVAAGAATLGVIHTQIASRQARIDDLDRRIVAAGEQFDTLRAIRAELRAPLRLDAAARTLDMEPAMSSSFLPVDPQVHAMVVAATGRSKAGADIPDDLGPLDQFRLVKVLGAVNP
ncbi:MAG: hypothetical protein ACO4BZ_07770 [Ilumatobacteraceae bacterium]